MEIIIGLLIIAVGAFCQSSNRAFIAEFLKGVNE